MSKELTTIDARKNGVKSLVHHDALKCSIKEIKAMGFHDLESYAQLMICVGKKATTTLAIILATARDEYFRSSTEWLVWAEALAGTERRQSFNLLAIGRMFIARSERYPDFYDNYAAIDYMKLAPIAVCDQDAQEQILDALPPEKLDAMSRDKVLAVVKTTMGITPKEEAEAEVAEAEAKVVDAFAKWVKLVKGLCTIDPDTASGIVQTLPADTLFRASVTMIATLEIAIDSGKMKDVDMSGAVAELQALIIKMKG